MRHELPPLNNLEVMSGESCPVLFFGRLKRGLAAMAPLLVHRLVLKHFVIQSVNVKYVQVALRIILENACDGGPWTRTFRI